MTRNADSEMYQWDWIAAVPHCIGPQALPKFLTEDFDPENYDYDVGAGEPKAGCLADSPEELACYRAMYAQFMESYLSEKDRMVIARNPRHARRVRLSRKDAATLTRRSLVTTTLQLAARAPSEMRELMKHLFEEIEELTAGKWPDVPATADSRVPGDGEEGVNKDGDTGASKVKTTCGVEEESCGGNPGSKETASNVETLPIDELMVKIEQLTGASEVQNIGVVEEESCVGNPDSAEMAVNIESLTIDWLMDKIEQLTGRSSAPTSTRATPQNTVDLQVALPSEEKTPEPGDEAHALNTKSDKKIARMPRVARVCGWVHKKLQRGAKHLHKQPKKGDAMASAESTPKSPKARPVRAARTFCGWTEKRLRRVAYCLHSDNDENTDKARIETMIEEVRSGVIDVLKGLQTKLNKLTQKLHRAENNSSVASGNSGHKASQKPKVTASTKELSRAEVHFVCDKFLHMVQDKQLHLTADQQVAIAHWFIHMLKDPEMSDMSSATTDTRPQGKPGRPDGDGVRENGDLEQDSAHGEDQKDEIASSGDDKDGDEDHGKNGQHDDGKEILDPMDRACDPNEEEPTEVPQSAVSQNRPKAVQKDFGALNLFDICIALSKGDIDQRRMKRLRDGFLGLLNQSV